MWSINRGRWLLVALVLAGLLAAGAFAEQALAGQTPPQPTGTPTAQSVSGADGTGPILMAEGAIGGVAAGLAGGYLVFGRRRSGKGGLATDSGQLQTIMSTYDSADFKMRRRRAAQDLLAAPLKRPASLDNVLSHFQTVERLLQRRELDEDLTIGAISAVVLDWAGVAARYRNDSSKNGRALPVFWAFVDRVVRWRGTEFEPPESEAQALFLNSEMLPDQADVSEPGRSVAFDKSSASGVSSP